MNKVHSHTKQRALSHRNLYQFVFSPGKLIHSKSGIGNWLGLATLE